MLPLRPCPFLTIAFILAERQTKTKQKDFLYELWNPRTRMGFAGNLHVHHKTGG